MKNSIKFLVFITGAVFLALGTNSFFSGCKKAEKTQVNGLNVSPPLEKNVSQSDWEQSFQEGQNIANSEKDQQKASYYFANALGKKPGEWKIINEYKNLLDRLVQTASGAENIEEQYSVLSAKELMLKGQITFVPADKMETLLSWIKETNDEKVKLSETVVGSDAPAEESTVTESEMSEEEGVSQEEFDAVAQTLQNKIR